MDEQRKAYLEKLKKEKTIIQRNMNQMKELQSMELRLLNNVQKATLYQQEVKQQYDEIVLAQTTGKSSGSTKMWGRGLGPPTAQGSWMGTDSPYDGPSLMQRRLNYSRPTTQPSYGGRIKDKIESARTRAQALNSRNQIKSLEEQTPSRDFYPE